MVTAPDDVLAELRDLTRRTAGWSRQRLSTLTSQAVLVGPISITSIIGTQFATPSRSRRAISCVLAWAGRAIIPAFLAEADGPRYRGVCSSMGTGQPLQADAVGPKPLRFVRLLLRVPHNVLAEGPWVQVRRLGCRRRWWRHQRRTKSFIQARRCRREDHCHRAQQSGPGDPADLAPMSRLPEQPAIRSQP